MQQQQRKELISNINAASSNSFQYNGTNGASHFNTSKATSSPRFNYKNHVKTKPYERFSPGKQNIAQENNIVTAKCVLDSTSRFSVHLSNYNNQAIELFKTIPSRSYDTKTRIWSFSLDHYEMLVSKFKTLSPHVVIEKFPTFVLKALQIPNVNISKIDFSRIDSKLCESLYSFQKDGIGFGIEKGGKVLIADDMGLGKTFQALGIADYFKDWPLLIITTSTMKKTWQSTILEYLPSIPVMYVQEMITVKDFINESKILIVSHDMVSRASSKLVDRKFGSVIIDESHAFKNYKNKGTQAVMNILKPAKRVILLSGTPALSRPSELYCQLALIDSKFFGSFFDYSKRYCDGKQSSFGWDSSGQSNLQELEIVLSKKFMIRRTKEETLSWMPNKSQEFVKLDVNLDKFSIDDKNCLNALAERYRQKVKKGGNVHAELLPFYAETAKIKIPSVISYILQLIENGEKKFLVFAHHQVMLNAIEKVLKKKNKKYIRIDSSVNLDQRKYMVDSFQTKEDYTCALLSITAANAGITLTAATLVIFTELHWNPSILSQAESRAHRIGQNKEVKVRYLIAPDTADDAIKVLLERKQKVLGAAGLSKDSFECAALTSQEPEQNKILTEGIHYTQKIDIRKYLNKAPEIEELNKSVIDELNSSMIEENLIDSNSFTEAFNTEKADNKEMFDDGFDDAMANIDTDSFEIAKDNDDDVDVFDDGLDDIFANIDV